MENRKRLHLLLKQMTRKVTGLRGIISTCADESVPRAVASDLRVSTARVTDSEVARTGRKILRTQRLEEVANLSINLNLIIGARESFRDL